MSESIRKTCIVLVTLALAVGMAAPAAMAAGVDTETTNTPSTSGVTEGTIIDGSYNGSVDSAPTLTATMTTTDGEVRVVDPESGDVINTLSTEDGTQTYSGTDLYYYNYTINSSNLGDFPIESGETKDVQFVIVDNSTVSESNEVTATVNGTITAESGYTHLRIGEYVTANNDLTSFESEESWWGFGETTNYSTVEQKDVNITGSDSVTMAFENSTTADHFDTAASGLSDGDHIGAAPVQISEAGEDATTSDYIKVYKNEAPEDINSSKTYGVYDTSTNELTIMVGDDIDADQVDIKATGNNGLGWLQSLQAYGVDWGNLNPL